MSTEEKAVLANEIAASERMEVRAQCLEQSKTRDLSSLLKLDLRQSLQEANPVLAGFAAGLAGVTTGAEHPRAPRRKDLLKIVKCIE